MRFTCQSCGRAYAVSNELSGRAFRMKCKGCGQEIVVRPANPGSGMPAETTGMVPLPVASAAPPPQVAPSPPAVAPPPPPQVAPPPPAVAPTPPAAAPPPPARLKEAPPSRPAVAPQPPPPTGPVEYDLDPLAGLDEEIEAKQAAAAPPPPPAPPAKLAAREVPRGPVASSARAQPAATSPPRRSLLVPGIALLTVLLVLGVGISFLRAKPPDRAPVPPAPAVETPILVTAPQLEPQPSAPPASLPPAGAETAAPRPSEKPSPALAPAPPPARSPATARAERLQAASDLPVERAPAEIVPTPARQPAVTAAPPPDPGPPRVANASAPLDVAPAPAPSAAAPTAPTVAAVAAPAPGPRYVEDGFQAPRLASRTCISETLRLPAKLDEDAPEMVVVRVAVGATGEVTQVQVMGQVADRRISDAVRLAVQACKWVPGADAQGTPTALQVVLPIRFAR